MCQYAVISVTLLSHHRSTYLAKPHSVAPSCTHNMEESRDTVGVNAFLINHKSRTIQMARTERTAYFEFLPYGKRPFFTHYFKLAKPATLTSFNRNKVNNLSKVNAKLAVDKLRKLRLGIVYTPAIEVGCFLIIVVQHLRENVFIRCVAEAVGRSANPFFGIGLYCQIWNRFLGSVTYRL